MYLLYVFGNISCLVYHVPCSCYVAKKITLIVSMISKLGGTGGKGISGFSNSPLFSSPTQNCSDIGTYWIVRVAYALFSRLSRFKLLD
jgi:hypothetical protein